MKNTFNGVIKATVYLLVFLLPIFFLPFSFEAFEFNKQYLLFFLVSVGFFAWLAKMVICDKEIKFRKSPINLLVLLFLFIAILSAVFSVDKFSSLLGFYGKFSDGLINLISLAAFYFLIINNTTIKSKDAKEETGEKTPLELYGLIKVFICSFFIVVLMSYLSFLGVQQIVSPVSGSLQGLAVFLAVMEILLVGLILLKDEGSKLFPIINYLLLIASLILLLIIDFTTAWIIIFAALIIFIIFALAKKIFQKDVNKLLLPIILAAVSLILIFVNLNQYYPAQFKNFLPEDILDQKTSWQVGLKSATSDIKSGFLGSGVGTFFYDFSKFKPTEFNNQKLLWQRRFDRAGNQFAEILGTMGFLGILSYLGLIALFLLMSWFFLQKSSGTLKMPLLTTFIALLIGQFVYYQNTVLAFTFWLILGLGVVSFRDQNADLKYRTVSFKNFPEIGLIFNLLLIILGLAILGFYFFAVRFYLADVNYAKIFRTQDATVQINNSEKAISLNPLRSQYYLTSARLYLNQALNQFSTEMAKPQDERDTVLIKRDVPKSIELAGLAATTSPNYVVAEETLGALYRDLQVMVSGTAEWGIKSFEKAINLEPTNPVLYTELGKLYLSLNDIQKARESFNKALELKSDYIDARIQEVLIYERENNLAEAIKKMEDLVQNYSFDQQTISFYPETLFQLGRLYFNNNQTADAITIFERVASLVPNNSNVFYSLGVAYTKMGEREKAIAAFEKVLELNPGNQDVTARLEELKK